jgi:hypothetical protein
MVQELKNMPKQKFLHRCWRIILKLIFIALILYAFKLIWLGFNTNHSQSNPSTASQGIFVLLLSLLLSPLIFKPKGNFAWSNKSFSTPSIVMRSFLLILLIIIGGIFIHNGKTIYQEVLMGKKQEAIPANVSANNPPTEAALPKATEKQYQISVESYLVSLSPPQEKEFVDANHLYSSSTDRVDSRDFVNVWQLRRELAEIEPLVISNNTDGCFTEGSSYSDNGSPPDAKELERRQQEDQVRHEKEQACVSDVESQYKKYITASAGFNQIWVPILMEAIHKGDTVAEVIMRQCQTTPILDRTQLESVCDASAERRSIADKRLLAIGFSPAFDWEGELREKSMFVNRQLGYGFKGRLDLQAVAIAGMRHGIYGLNSRELTPFSYINRTQDNDQLITYQNTVLIQLARKHVLRAFTLPGYPTLRLNRSPIINSEFTWGPVFLEQAKKGIASLDPVLYPFETSMSFTKEEQVGGIFPNLPKTGSHEGLDVNIYEKRLGEILSASEAAINFYLKQDPRWAVFLINRINHHEYLPVGTKISSNKLDLKLLGQWKLEKSYENWKLAPEKTEGILDIRADGEYIKATLNTEASLQPPLQDVRDCTLRYSGGTTYLWSHAGLKNVGFEDHPSYESSTPLGDLSGYYSLRAAVPWKNPEPIDMSVFALFDPNKKYEQILMQCTGGETLNSDRVRFLLLVDGVLIEIATETPNRRPVFVRQYERVTSVSRNK